MKNRHRGSRQGARKGRRGSDQAQRARRNQIRQAVPSTRSSTSSRRQTTDSVGKLDKESALQAVRDMGLSVDSEGNVDLAAARKVAEGAAISAARALGIEIRDADGRIDTVKARQAISRVLGFSVEREGAGEQAAAAVRVQKGAIAAAKSLLKTAVSLGIAVNHISSDLTDPNGNLNTMQALQIAEIALNIKVSAQTQRLSRKEAIDSLNNNLNVFAPEPLPRRAASDAVEKLLSASPLSNR